MTDFKKLQTRIPLRFSLKALMIVVGILGLLLLLIGVGDSPEHPVERLAYGPSGEQWRVSLPSHHFRGEDRLRLIVRTLFYFKETDKRVAAVPGGGLLLGPGTEDMHTSSSYPRDVINFEEVEIAEFARSPVSLGDVRTRLTFGEGDFTVDIVLSAGRKDANELILTVADAERAFWVLPNRVIHANGNHAEWHFLNVATRHRAEEGVEIYVHDFVIAPGADSQIDGR